MGSQYNAFSYYVSFFANAAPFYHNMIRILSKKQLHFSTGVKMLLLKPDGEKYPRYLLTNHGRCGSEERIANDDAFFFPENEIPPRLW